MKRGYKKCPKCGNHCGLRTRICKCRYNFVSKNNKKTKVAEKIESTKSKLKKKIQEFTDQDERNIFVSKIANNCKGRMILYPAGNCPIKLTKFSENDIRDWRLQVIGAGEQIGLFYGPSAIRYFAHQFVPWGSTKSKEISWILETIFKEEYNFVENLCKEKEDNNETKQT